MEKLDKLIPLFLLLGAIVLFGVYWPALSGPFLLDDHSNIPQTKLPEFSWLGLYEVAMSNSSGIIGRPLPVATFALNHYFSDGGTFAFKLTNWSLHAIISVLIYLFVFKLLVLAGGRPESVRSATQCRFVALLVAAIWALHPIQVSTVMYVVQRMSQFSTLFTLLALISYVYGRSNLERGGSRFLTMSAGTLVFGVLACMSKETGVLIPVYILLIEWVIFSYRFDNGKYRKAFWCYHSVFVFIPLIFGAVIFLLLLPDLMSGYKAGETGFTVIERLRTQPVVVMEYLGVILIPHITSMNLYHDSTIVHQSINGVVLLALAGVALMGVGLLLFRKKAPVLSLGIGIFLISHLLESTFLPLEMKFEHRNYLAILGVVLPLAWYLVVLISRYSRQSVAIATALCALSLLSYQTYARSTYWGEELKFHLNSVENDPLSYRARTWLAVSLVKSGQSDRAIEQYKISETLESDNTYPSLGILQARCAASEYSPADFVYALEQISTHAVTLDVVTSLLNISENHRNGFCSRPDRSEILQLYDAAAMNPQQLLQGFARSAFAEHYASLLLKDGQTDRAMSVLSNAVAADPQNIELLWRYALKLFESERYGLARETLIKLGNIGSVKTVSYKKRMDRMKELLDQRQVQLIEIAEDVDE